MRGNHTSYTKASVESLIAHAASLRVMVQAAMGNGCNGCVADDCDELMRAAAYLDDAARLVDVHAGDVHRASVGG